ncbi:hypothetical protein M9H77_30615 [Catharanthus roseus]|uniref:Uncharacterized protein n=1 Tax=Catharanthus roseus TaxID=4058 RepID=A0ACB9ZXQ8_CATRO|nr:hypothetical protein M9H77_30615 [Catharanthus roseus]
MREATPRPEQATHKLLDFEEWQRIGGLELPKLGHSRTNHGPGTIFKKNLERNTYLVGFRKTAIGSATTPYKRPGQGPWKPRDFKRSRGEQRTRNEGRPTLTPGGAHRDIPRTSALRCNKYLRRRPEKQADPWL